MKEYLQNKTVGFYCTAVAAVLAIIGVICYGSATKPISVVYALVIMTAVVEVALILLLKAREEKAILELVPTVCAILMAVAVGISFTNQIDALGFFAVGMYSLDDMLGFFLFAIFGILAIILFTAASYMNLVKREAGKE